VNRIIASRLWLFVGEKKMINFIRKAESDISIHENYWLKNLKKRVKGKKYLKGQLVFHIHNLSCYDVWLPLKLQKLLSDHRIEVRYVFWGSGLRKIR